MSDIAILVAEEYERRVKQTAAAEYRMMMNRAAEEKASSPVKSDRKKSPETGKKLMLEVDEKIESLKRRFEAKSQFALAASCGLFSA